MLLTALAALLILGAPAPSPSVQRYAHSFQACTSVYLHELGIPQKEKEALQRVLADPEVMARAQKDPAVAMEIMQMQTQVANRVHVALKAENTARAALKKLNLEPVDCADETLHAIFRCDMSDDTTEGVCGADFTHDVLKLVGVLSR